MDNKPVSPSSPEPDPPARPDELDWERERLSVPVERTLAAVDDQSDTEISTSSSPTSVRESVLRDGFIGPAGVYPGVRWLIYLALAWTVYQVEGWLLVSLRSDSSLGWRVMVEGSMMLAAILPGFMMARVEDRPFADFGLPGRFAFGRNFWVGSLWGIGSLTVLMLTLRATGVFEFGTLSLHGARIWKFATYYAVLFLLTGFFEEFLVRGYSQWVLAQAMKFWPAAAFLSCAFGYIHRDNPGESKTGLIAAGLIGFFLCLTLRRTGDLWWAVGFHMAWDWGESYLYSVPDSGALLPGHLLNSSLHGPDWLTGGSVGPEGSYLVFAVIGVLWILFDRVYPEVKYGRVR